MACASPHDIDNPFLLEAIEALAHCRQSALDREAAPAIHRAIEFRNGGTCARVEILFRQCRNQMLSIHLWENRAISLHAGEAIRNGGWKFHFSSAGRFLATQDGQALVRAAEASLTAMAETTDADPERLEAIWQPLIARGPRLV